MGATGASRRTLGFGPDFPADSAPPPRVPGPLLLLLPSLASALITAARSGGQPPAASQRRSAAPTLVGGYRGEQPGSRGRKALIQNPLYLGFIRCQGQTSPGKRGALVSHDLWEQAHALLDARPSRGNPSSPRDEHVHLLKGLIHCGDCGSTMTPHPSGKIGKDGERFLYYACTAVIHERTRCPCRVRRLPVRKFEDALIHLLGEIAGDGDVILRLAEEGRHRVGEELPRLHRGRGDRRSSCGLLAERSTRLIELLKIPFASLPVAAFSLAQP